MMSKITTIILLLFISLNVITYASPTPTRCADQMGNLFANFNFTTQKEVVTFTTGTVGNISFVEASLEFQKASREYVSDFFGNNTIADTQFASYISIDKPWCATNIVVTCATRKIFGLRKTGTCTDLIDRDLVTRPPVAGRIMIYPDQSPPCNGTATIRFDDTILQVGNITGEYTYDVDGLVNTNLKTESVAISTYKGAACPYSDGSPFDAALQTQFRCLEPKITCSSPRPSNSTIISPFLRAKSRCIGDVVGNDNIKETVWQVINFEPPEGLESEFDIRFRETPTSSIVANFEDQLLRESSKRQFIAPFDTLDHIAQGAFGSFQFTDFSPTSSFPNPSLPDIPCICGFSMDCDGGGNIQLGEVSGPILRNNTRPVSITQPSATIILGDNYTFDGTSSFDLDNGPGPLHFLWLQLSGPTTVNIPDPQANITVVSFSEFVIGVYTFVLYVSDTQDIGASAIFSVTVQNGKPVAKAGPDQFVLVNTTIILNGTESFDQDNSPLPLVYNWTQFIGWPVNITNSTSPIATFFPVILGLYMFRLTVFDGNQSGFDFVTINVVSRLDIPIPPVPPPIPPSTGAMPPPVAPPNPIPTIPVPEPGPFPPLPPIPPTPGTNSSTELVPLFPQRPLPTTIELLWITLVATLFIFFAAFFCAMEIYYWPETENNYLAMRRWR